MKITRITLLAALAIGGIALAGCSSSDSASESTASPQASVSDQATAPAQTSTGATPSAADLVPTVEALIDAQQTAQERAANVVGGEDLAATFVKLDDYISQGPPVTFEIVDPTLKDGTVTANVKILSDGVALEQLYPSFWQADGDVYKITRTGACSLIAVSGITCPDAAAS